MIVACMSFFLSAFRLKIFQTPYDAWYRVIQPKPDKEKDRGGWKQSHNPQYCLICLRGWSQAHILKKLLMEDQSNKEHSKHIIRLGVLPEYLNLLSWRKRQLLMTKHDDSRLEDFREIDLDFSNRFTLEIEAIVRTDFEFVSAFQDSLLQ